MKSLLHVGLMVDAESAIEPVATSLLGPRLRIGDGTNQIDITLPFGPADAERFLRRLSDAALHLGRQITESGTGTTTPPR